MKKIISLFLLLIVSCNNEPSMSDKVYSGIQGDWFYHNTSTPYFLSIKDSLLFRGEHIDSFETFRIKNDTINLINSKVRYCFSKITPKYLKIIDKNSGKEIPVFISSEIFRDEMITLRGLEIRFRTDYRGLLDWGIIIDEDFNCFIKIKLTKKSPYIKNPFNLSQGVYKCEFNELDFEFFQNKVRNVPLDSLKTSYHSDHFGYHSGDFCFNGNYDRAIIFLDIHYSFLKSTEIKTKSIIAKGYEGIPPFLGVFINYLNKISSFVKFSGDTTSFNEFKFYSENFVNKHRDIFSPFEKGK